MDRTALLAKIRGLLNKTVANGATEAEAATAMAHAERIMAQHDIAMADAFAAGEGIEFDETIARHFGARLPGYTHDVARVVEEVFGVHVVFKSLRFRDSNRLAGYNVLIFGEASKIDAATWGFNFLCDTFRRLWTEFRIRKGVASSESQTYYSGLKDGFLAKIAEGQPAEPASNTLVKLDAALNEAFQSAYPGLQQKIVRFRGDDGVYAAGLRDGRKINLARPLGEAQTLALPG